MKHDIAVECIALSRHFDDTAAVDQIDLQVERGQILTVLGPSGCGKTTLLRLIAGFEAPDAGQVKIDGRLVASPGYLVPPEQRRVGMVFQEHALFPHLTVSENIAFGLFNWNGEERQSRLKHLMNLVGLKGKGDRFPHELSGGESQRVALARALAPEPSVVLMDEPFSNLDADRRIRIRDQVRFILKQTATTVIFVTHDQEEALFMGDRLAVMRNGRLEQVDHAEEIFRAPASGFVAEFLGQAEFLPATVVEGGLETELGVIEQPVEANLGTVLEVAFRADDLTFEPDPQGNAMVLARYFQGAVTTYRLRLGSGRIVHSLQPHYLEYGPGTQVRARLDANHPLPLFEPGAAVPAGRKSESTSQV